MAESEIWREHRTRLERRTNAGRLFMLAVRIMVDVQTANEWARDQDSEVVQALELLARGATRLRDATKGRS